MVEVSLAVDLQIIPGRSFGFRVWGLRIWGAGSMVQEFKEILA